MSDNTIDPKDALQAIESDKKARVEAATQEINAILAKYNVALDASMTVTTRGNALRIEVIPRG